MTLSNQKRHPTLDKYCPYLAQVVFSQNSWSIRRGDEYANDFGVVLDQIIVSYPRGNCILEDTVRSMEILKEIMNAYPHKMILIEDYSDFYSATWEARNQFIREIRGLQDHIRAMIFVTESTYFSFVIKLSKTLYKVPFPVLQSKKYADAVSLIRQFIPYDESQCRAHSNLPIQIFQFDQLTTHVQILPSHILYVKFEGGCSATSVDAWFVYMAHLSYRCKNLIF